MKNRKRLHALVVSVLTTGLAMPILQAAEPTAPVRVSPQTSYGAIVGVVTDSAKLPLARATVTAVRADGTAIRATVSGSDGVYSFADLTPGAWSITSQADGYSDTGMVSLEVKAGRATRSDIAMDANASVQPAVISSISPAGQESAAGPATAANQQAPVN